MSMLDFVHVVPKNRFVYMSTFSKFVKKNTYVVTYSNCQNKWIYTKSAGMHKVNV